MKLPNALIQKLCKRSVFPFSIKAKDLSENAAKIGVLNRISVHVRKLLFFFIFFENSKIILVGWIRAGCISFSGFSLNENENLGQFSSQLSLKLLAEIVLV